MNKEETKAVAEEVAEILRNKNYNVRVDEVVKNGLPMTGITVCGMKDDESIDVIAPTFYVESFYEDYFDTLPSPKFIAREILAQYENLVIPEDIKAFVKDAKNNHIDKKTLFAVLRGDRFFENEDKNKFIFRQVCDGLYVVVKQLIMISEDRLFSRSISLKDCELMEMTEEEIIDYALANTPSLFEFKIADFFGMKVLTNKRKLNAAVGIVFPQIQAEAKRILETEKFYILPSSVHDVILIPVDDGRMGDITDIKDLIRNTNETVLQSDEFLSNELFFFNGEKIVKID